MQKYIVKNINTNEISEQDIPQAFIDQLLEVGQDYNGFIKATQEEVGSFNESKIDKELEEAKNIKIAELDSLYQDQSTWIVMLNSTALKAQLVKEISWFSAILPAADGSEPLEFFDSKDKLCKIRITNAQALKLNNFLTLKKGKEIKNAYVNGKKEISSLKSITNIQDVNVADFFNKINRVVDIDKFFVV
jgi:hypothetical protein